MALFLVSVFVCGLGSAIVSSLLIHFTGPAIGIIIFIVAAYFLLLRKGGLFHRVYRALTMSEM